MTDTPSHQPPPQQPQAAPHQTPYQVPPFQVPPFQVPPFQVPPTYDPAQPPYRQLRRPTTDRIVAGVASGLGRYFAVDPTLVRVIFAVSAILTGGVALLAYPVMWFVMPAEPAGAPAWPHPAPAWPHPAPAWSPPAPGTPPAPPTV